MYQYLLILTRVLCNVSYIIKSWREFKHCNRRHKCCLNTIRYFQDVRELLQKLPNMYNTRKVMLKWEIKTFEVVNVLKINTQCIYYIPLFPIKCSLCFVAHILKCPKYNISEQWLCNNSCFQDTLPCEN